MALRLNKTSKIVFAISIVILLGALGYLIWRVNQKETTAPEESEAGENSCNCCEIKGDGSIPTCDVHVGTDIPCSCTYKVGACGGDVDQCVVSECTEGSECSEHCVWPSVNFCDRVNGGVCTCRTTNNNCGTNDPCDISCPSGYSECSSGTGCETREDECTCPDCKNIYYVQIKCKKDAVTPVCGNGTKDSGEACDPKASPTGCNAGYTCKNDCTCAAITCGNGKLNTGEECEVGNPTGTSCTWDNCNQTSCTCRQLTITKSGVNTCLNTDTQNPIAELTYTITMKNEDTDNRTITKVKDVLDAKILAAGIVPTAITSPGVYADGKIVWKYDTTNLIIKGGESKVLTYKVSIDKDHFGTYKNTVTMTRSTGVASEATATVLADCTIATPLAGCGDGVLGVGESCELDNPTGASCTWDSCNKSLCVCIAPTVPQTGIFDSTLGRIAIGIALLIIGVVVYTIPSRVLILQKKENTYKYRGRFEKRVTK